MSTYRIADGSHPIAAISRERERENEEYILEGTRNRMRKNGINQDSWETSTFSASSSLSLFCSIAAKSSAHKRRWQREKLWFYIEFYRIEEERVSRPILLWRLIQAYYIYMYIYATFVAFFLPRPWYFATDSLLKTRTSRRRRRITWSRPRTWRRTNELFAGWACRMPWPAAPCSLAVDWSAADVGCGACTRPWPWAQEPPSASGHPTYTTSQPNQRSEYYRLYVVHKMKCTRYYILPRDRSETCPWTRP